MFNMMPNPLNEELTDNTKNGQCISCGECCSNSIALTANDIVRIRRYMKRNGITKPEDHTAAYNLLVTNPARTLDLTCPFLVIKKPSQANGEQRAYCKIYPVRPAVCKGFTCKIASDPHYTEEIYNTMRQELTDEEIKQLADTAPSSMRDVFFGR